jgi:hypothetical protein
MQEMTNMKVTILFGIGQMANLMERKNLQGEMEPLMMKKCKVIAIMVFRDLFKSDNIMIRRENN